MSEIFSPEVLARVGHGAIEVDLPDRPPLMVVVIGPIKVWWQPGQWDTPAHQRYVQWRDAVVALLVREGHLVYSPHAAWRGAWAEAAQAVNDAAIRHAHAVVNVTPPGILADGTAAEVVVALTSGTRVLDVPPAGEQALADLAEDLRHLHEDLSRAPEPFHPAPGEPTSRPAS